MSLSSMFIGRQGIAAHQQAINLATNNIANVNSVAFKKSSVSFANGITNVIDSGVGPSISSGGTQPKVFGSGVSVQSESVNFTQGSLKQTGTASTLALMGRGFFALSSTGSVSQNERNEFLYTRDGSFNIDAEGNLVNSEGQSVMGVMFYNDTTDEMKSVDNTSYNSVTYFSDQDIGSSIKTSLTPDYSVDNAVGMPAIDTNTFSELSIRSGLTDKPIDITDGEFNVSQVNGLIKFTFTDTSGNIPRPSNVFSIDLSESYVFETKSNTFIMRNNNGEELQLRLRVKPETTRLSEVFTGFSYDASSLEGSSITLSSAKDSPKTQVGHSVTLDEIDLPHVSGAEMKTFIEPIKFPPIFYSPDPKSEVMLSKYSIGQDGSVSIEGVGTTGRMEIARIVLANFQNLDGLINNGRGYYSPSANSGQAALQVIGGPSTNENLKLGTTQVLSNTLEYSNVDLADEMTHMIAYQRGLQGNARVITVANELLGTLMQM